MSKYLPRLPVPENLLGLYGVGLEPHFWSVRDAQKGGWRSITVPLDLSKDHQQTIAYGVVRSLKGGVGRNARGVEYAIVWENMNYTMCEIMRRADELIFSR